jgi:hypothetical protein
MVVAAAGGRGLGAFPMAVVRVAVPRMVLRLAVPPAAGGAVVGGRVFMLFDRR